MESFIPERVDQHSLLEFLHRLNLEKLQIESINISYSAKIDESKKEEVSIGEVIDTDARADYD
ncbi:MAG: hypothetical protein IJD90_00410 [Clostridia bacterium]|nr:hypothetical protein [Clostridia bacterium]